MRVSGRVGKRQRRLSVWFETNNMGIAGTLVVLLFIGLRVARSYHRYQEQHKREQEVQDRIHQNFENMKKRDEAQRQQILDRQQQYEQRFQQQEAERRKRSDEMLNRVWGGQPQTPTPTPAPTPPVTTSSQNRTTSTPPQPRPRTTSTAPRSQPTAPARPVTPPKPVEPPKPAFNDPAMVTSLPLARPISSFGFGGKDNRPALLDSHGVRVLALEQKRVLRDFEASMFSVADDGTVATKLKGVRDAKVWNPETGIQSARLPVGEDVEHLLMKRDGSYVLAYGKTIRGWDVNTQKATTAFAKLGETQPGRVTAAAISPDGRRAALIIPPALVIWDLAGDKLATRVPVRTTSIDHVQFGESANDLLWCHNDDVDLWQLAQPKMVRQMGGKGRITASHARGDMLVTMTDIKVLHLWRLSDGKHLSNHACESLVNDVKIAPSNRYVLGAMPDKIGVWGIDKLLAE